MTINNVYFQVEELNATLVEKNLAIEGLEKERDFYFGKLRDIEVLAQELESAEIAGPEFSQKILGVLYATEVTTLFFFPLYDPYVNFLQFLLQKL
jgi:RP/EB family microtubule-associated protein